MDTDGFSSKGARGNGVAARLSTLTERRHELRDELFNCRDQEARIRLVAELDANQEELLQLQEHLRLTPEGGAPSTVPPPTQSPRATEENSPNSDSTVTASHSYVEVAATSTAGDTMQVSNVPDESPRPDRRTVRDVVGGDGDRRIPLAAIIVAIGALALLAWFVFLRPTDSPVATEATTGTVETETQVVDQVQTALEGLSYASVVAEERSGTLFLIGAVDSANDLDSVISVVEVLAGDLPINTSGISVGEADESAAPPASVPDEITVEPLPLVVEGPYVRATLDGRDFVLLGAVPSAELANGYIQAAQAAFSPYFRSQLAVDEQLEQVDWLSAGPQAVLVLPMLIEGEILIAEGQVQVSGWSPNEPVIERLQGALGQITGLPVEVDKVLVTDLEAPTYVMSADAGVVELSGLIPSDEIRDMLVAGAEAAYGPDNVVDQITVDSGVYEALWMHSGGPLMQAMSTFPDYELRVDGMAFSGFINGGVDFEPGSAVFSGDYAGALDVGVSVLSRDPSLQLIIEGHTDDRGSDDANLALSQQRADAVRDYFIEKGIDPSRLTAIGYGESEPVVPNDSEEGRARNRRIQYVLSTGA